MLRPRLYLVTSSKMEQALNPGLIQHTASSPLATPTCPVTPWSQSPRTRISHPLNSLAFSPPSLSTASSLSPYLKLMKLWSPNLDATYRPSFLAPNHPQVPYQPGLPWRQTGRVCFPSWDKALSPFRYPPPGFLQGP